MTQDNASFVPKGFSVRERTTSGEDVFALADESGAPAFSLPAAADVKAFVRANAPLVAKDGPAAAAEQLTAALGQGLTFLRQQEQAQDALNDMDSLSSLAHGAKGSFTGLAAVLAHHKIKEADFFKALWAHVVEKRPDLKMDSFQRQELISELHGDFAEAGETVSAIAGKGMKKVLQSMKLKMNIADVAVSIGAQTADFVRAELAILTRQNSTQPCLTADSQAARAQNAAAPLVPYTNLDTLMRALAKKAKDAPGFDAARLSDENRARYASFFPKIEAAAAPVSTSMSGSWREAALCRELRTVLDHEKSDAIVHRVGELRLYADGQTDDAATMRRVDYLSDTVAREKVIPRLASAFRQVAQYHVDGKPAQMLRFTVPVDAELAQHLTAKDDKAADLRAKTLAKETLNRLMPPPRKP